MIHTDIYRSGDAARAVKAARDGKGLVAVVASGRIQLLNVLAL